jgi:general secretion pathway protein G
MMAGMLSRPSAEPRVFFPWEKKRGLLGVFGRRRARVLVTAGIVTLLVVAIYENGERSAAVRATRATLTTVSRALSTYRADHGGACPGSMGDLAALGYVHADTADAWGRPLRLVCPGRVDAFGFDLSSDGPDGLPGGLDEVR